MATTSPDNLRTPNSSDPYNLVPDLQVLANDVQSALVDRANSYRGTSAQRTAFSNAPTGTIWSDTNGSQSVYVKRGSSWAYVTPEDTGWVSRALNAEFSGSLETRIINGIVWVRCAISTDFAGGKVLAVLPSGVRPASSASFLVRATGNVFGYGTIASGGTIFVRPAEGPGFANSSFMASYPLG